MNKHYKTKAAFLVSGACIFIIGVVSTLYVANTVDNSIRSHLSDRARTMAEMFEIDRLKTLTGSEADLLLPEYALLKEKLIRVRSVNSDVRFIYLLVKKEEQVIFLADSEPDTSEDYSPPGQVYSEASEELHRAFETNEGFLEGPIVDRWGTWLSAIYPIKDPLTNEVVAEIGLDFNAKEYYQTIYGFSSLPALLTLVLLTILWAVYFFIRNERRFLEARAKFLSIASHDIRTPLTGIRWVAENMMKDSSMPASKVHTLSLLHKSASNLLQRLNTLLNMDALEHHRKLSLIPRKINAAALIEEIVEMLYFFAEHRYVTVEFSPSWQKNIPIEADEEKIRHVFSNIISNAVKYTNPHSRVDISYESKGNFHVFKVADRGPGVSEKDIPRIFEGYYRTLRTEGRYTDQESTGMGLYTAQQYARLHGGTIEVASRDGGGTVFTIGIPKTHNREKKGL
jgi:signal transduction histidine kinase